MLKKIVFVALGFISLVHAGVIENRKTGETICFQADFERQQLLVNFNEEDVLLSLERFELVLDDLKLEFEEMGLFGLPFSRTGMVVNLMKEEKVKNPLLLASGYVLPLVLDLYALPLDILDNGFYNLKINKDVKLIRKVIETDTKVMVTKRRFNRILNLLGI